MAQCADTTLFWAAMFAGAPLEVVMAFGADRAAMSAGMNRIRPADATTAYKSYLRCIASMLDGQDFVLGSVPSVADIACCHPLWFTTKRVPVLADIFSATPAVLAWMERMAAMGQEQSKKYLL